MSIATAFTTSSLIDPSRYHISGEIGKVYANPIGELYVSDNEQRAQFFPEYIGATAGEKDFAVAYASGNMVALADLPFVPSDENIVFVKRVPATGSAETYTKRTHDIKYWTGTIQVISASFAATDHFVIGLYGQKTIAKQTLTDTVVFGTDTGWISGATWYNCKGYKHASLFIKYGFGAATGSGPSTLYMEIDGTCNTSLSDEYYETLLPHSSSVVSLGRKMYAFTPSTRDGAAVAPTEYTEYKAYARVDIEGLHGFKACLSESIGDAQLTGTVQAIYYTLSKN